MARSWILVGMMGSGKSTVGRIVADLAEREFVDTDQLIVRRLGRPINQLFSIYGQDAFRDHENAVLRALEPGSYVVATGGGIVVREANWTELRRLGTSVYLDCPLDLLIARLEKSPRKRPLLAVENWQDRLAALLEERLPLYRKADVVVPLVDENLEGAAGKVHAAVRDLE